MSILLTTFVFIVIFSVLVLVHEFGHFIVARKSGITVEEFGFGLPPRIWGVKKGDTLYSINLIPFGGFVRLLGEDDADTKLLKNKKSFSSKSPRVRMMVIIAGVVMNFLLAVLLLTTGFIVGIKPLIITGDDVFMAIERGGVGIETGVIVKTVDSGSPADKAGLKIGDRILKIDGKEIKNNDQFHNVFKEVRGTSSVVDIMRGDELKVLVLQIIPGNVLGFGIYDLLPMPRVAIREVLKSGVSEKAGIRNGDVVLSINGKQVYFPEDLLVALSGVDSMNYKLARGNTVVDVVLKSFQNDSVVVSSVISGSPAEKAGILDGDSIVSVNGVAVKNPQNVIDITKAANVNTNTYGIRREGQIIYRDIKIGADGLIGVGLSPVVSFLNTDFSFYSVDYPTSVVRIDDVRYPFWTAPIKAIEESGRLSSLTVSMFLGFIQSLFTKFAVPEGVSGPVGIAQLTSVFVQEGFMSLIRFMALLSMSLAIINIFPFPALDGGRLLFIVAEVLVGKKIGARFESIVHAVGFVFLMLLIFAVTYKDVIRLF